MSQGEITFRVDTGLTDGNVFTPTTIMTIASDGNVGINEVAPLTRFQVRESDEAVLASLWREEDLETDDIIGAYQLRTSPSGVGRDSHSINTGSC